MYKWGFYKSNRVGGRRVLTGKIVQFVGFGNPHSSLLLNIKREFAQKTAKNRRGILSVDFCQTCPKAFSSTNWNFLFIESKYGLSLKE